MNSFRAERFRTAAGHRCGRRSAGIVRRQWAWARSNCCRFVKHSIASSVGNLARLMLVHARHGSRHFGAGPRTGSGGHPVIAGVFETRKTFAAESTGFPSGQAGTIDRELWVAAPLTTMGHGFQPRLAGRRRPRAVASSLAAAAKHSLWRLAGRIIGNSFRSARHPANRNSNRPLDVGSST